jgi:hypothetical protein
MTRLIRSAALATALLGASALAGGSVQTHQCVKDGQAIQKTKKDCHKAGGQWQKMAAGKAATETKPAEGKTAEPEAAPSAEPAAK